MTMSVPFRDTTPNSAESKFAEVFIAADTAPTTSHWQLSGASVRGLSHQQHNLPCQDRHGYCQLVEYPDWAIAVVADGAGSKSHSDIGAQIVVDETLSFVKSWLRSQLESPAQSQLVFHPYFDFEPAYLPPNLPPSTSHLAGGLISSDSHASHVDKVMPSYTNAVETNDLLTPPVFWQAPFIPPVLPKDSQLNQLADQLYQHLYSRLHAYASQQDIPVSALGCTLIASILSPIGVTLIHIGDGRAAYQDTAGDWHALMQPWKDDEGYTVFVTTQALQQSSRQAGSNSHDYIRATTVTQPIQAVVLMSDGCESSAFECQVFDAAKQQYIRPNRPFARFLDPVKSTLMQLHHHYGHDRAAINSRFAAFLQQGADSLKKEGDDKTLVFAVYQPLTSPSN